MNSVTGINNHIVCLHRKENKLVMSLASHSSHLVPSSYGL